VSRLAHALQRKNCNAGRVLLQCLLGMIDLVVSLSLIRSTARPFHLSYFILDNCRFDVDFLPSHIIAFLYSSDQIVDAAASGDRAYFSSNRCVLSFCRTASLSRIGTLVCACCTDFISFTLLSPFYSRIHYGCKQRGRCELEIGQNGMYRESQRHV
jgi:hypothetical protein